MYGSLSGPEPSLVHLATFQRTQCYGYFSRRGSGKSFYLQTNFIFCSRAMIRAYQVVKSFLRIFKKQQGHTVDLQLSSFVCHLCRNGLIFCTGHRLSGIQCCSLPYEMSQHHQLQSKREMHLSLLSENHKCPIVVVYLSPDLLPCDRSSRAHTDLLFNYQHLDDTIHKNDYQNLIPPTARSILILCYFLLNYINQSEIQLPDKVRASCPCRNTKSSHLTESRGMPVKSEGFSENSSLLYKSLAKKFPDIFSKCNFFLLILNLLQFINDVVSIMNAKRKGPLPVPPEQRFCSCLLYMFSLMVLYVDGGGSGSNM